MKSIRTTLSLVALAATCAYGQTVAYTNFTTTDHSYVASSIYYFGVDPTQTNFMYSLAFQFVPTVSGTVSDIYAGIDSTTGTPSSVSLAIYSDNGAGFPVPLAQLGDSQSGTTAGTGSGFMHVAYTGGAGSMGASLTAGTTYWLLATGNDSVWDQWGLDSSLSGQAAVSYDGNQTFQNFGTLNQGYMEVDVKAAPEPLMLVPLAAGLIGVLALKRKA